MSGTPSHTPLAHSGHFSDTPEPGARGVAGILPRTPRFWGDSRGDSLKHFGPEGPERLLQLVGGFAIESAVGVIFGRAMLALARIPFENWVLTEILTEEIWG